MTATANTDWDYVHSKIRHLKRMGLVSNQSTGVGFHGGAAPDWLVQEQKARRKAYAEKRDVAWLVAEIARIERQRTAAGE